MGLVLVTDQNDPPNEYGGPSDIFARLVSCTLLIIGPIFESEHNFLEDVASNNVLQKFFFIWRQ